MRRHVAWVLASTLILQGCAKEQVIHPPTAIGVLTSAHEALAEEGPLTDDPVLVDPVMRVSSRLIGAARQSADAPRVRALCWTIAVYADPALRAFVRSDGIVAVYVGIFRLAQTEAGLAALLGHELAHALADDTTPLSPPCLRVHDQPPPLSTYQEEREADSAGLMLMADAGYDPRELLQLWERMRTEQRERDKVHEHLTYQRRMEQIAERLPAAIMRYERSNRAPQKRLPSRESH
jgi:predicted Zn-dependent protease